MFPFKLHVVSIPVKANFRGIKNREIALFEGPAGWSEFSPFIEYSNKESSTWLKAAIEGATKEPPTPIRNEVQINATLPNVKVSEVKELLAGFNDGHAEEGVQAGAATLLGLKIAKEMGA